MTTTELQQQLLMVECLLKANIPFEEHMKLIKHRRKILKIISETKHDNQ